MHALEVGDFGLISGTDQGLESRFDQRAGSAAKDGLLSEQVGFSFFGECGLDDSGSRVAQSFRVRQRQLLGLARRILMNGDQGRNASTFAKHFTTTVPRRSGSDP